jgi:hypothetical protein
MDFNIWTAKISVAFKIIVVFFYTCMFHYFLKIYISYICIDVILIFFVFILMADQRGEWSILHRQSCCKMQKMLWVTGNLHKCKKKSLRYILQVIVMLFFYAKVIPANPQIHRNVMCPLFVLNFIFEPLFVHAPDIIVFFKLHLGTYTLVNKICWYCKCRTDKKLKTKVHWNKQ